jgi:hypothetical protein
MSKEKPKDIDEYKNWLREEHRVEILDRTKTYYESVTSRVKIDFEKYIFWKELTDKLKEYDAEYLVETGYHLLVPSPGPELYIKPFESFLIKTFRKNILENKNWPNEPNDGWIFPNNWYCKINDIVRSLFVVKYIDGVEFMANKVKCLCEKHMAECKIFLEAREEGYYAAHLYTKQNFEVPKITWDTERVDVSIEI